VTDTERSARASSRSSAAPDELVRQWLQSFESALSSSEASRVRDHLVDDSHWRDLVAFTWNLQQAHGADAVTRELVTTAPKIKPRHFTIATGFTPPREITHWEREVVEAVFDFETALGLGRGVVRLLRDSEGPAGSRAWLLLTTLRDLTPCEERSADLHVERYGFDQIHPNENWSDYRHRQRNFDDREPEVLIVGAGHCGLIIAAQLKQLGVDALVVDRFPRVGDVWRNRYHSLALHFPTTVCHLPHLPFPDSFPKYLSKDQLGNWLEFYADAMELNIWTSTKFLRGEFDAHSDRWRATVQPDDGTERVLHPQHLVMATGAFGNIPNVPDLHGLRSFRGSVLHTSQFRSGETFAGQKVAVVGVGTSGHDTAMEVYRHGGDVTMLQRGPVTVVDLGTMEKLPWASYAPGAPLEEIDLVAAANIVFPMAREAIRASTLRQAENDSDLLGRLEAAGMQITIGRDEGGFQLQSWRTGGGYYINVGASDAVANGDIKVLQMADLVAFTTDGLELRDGRSLDLDAVILATGFQNAKADLASLFGSEIAERMGGILNLDDFVTGEWSNTWRPTAQRNLWVNAGGFPQARFYSRLLALQLKARLSGLVDDHP